MWWPYFSSQYFVEIIFLRMFAQLFQIIYLNLMFFTQAGTTKKRDFKECWKLGMFFWIFYVNLKGFSQSNSISWLNENNLEFFFRECNNFLFVQWFLGWCANLFLHTKRPYTVYFLYDYKCNKPVIKPNLSFSFYNTNKNHKYFFFREIDFNFLP